MQNIFELNIGENFHHAYILAGERINSEKVLLDFLILRDFIKNANQDPIRFDFESISIEDVRDLKMHHNEKSSDGSKRVFLINALSINHEAQNALLKILEEPGEDTFFFFILPRVNSLHPTLLSRVQVISLENFLPEDNFFTKPVKDRLDFVADLIKKHKDDETSGNLRNVAVQILNNYELSIKNKKKLISRDESWKLKEVIKMRQYLSTPGASVKMILEHLALVI